VCKDVSAMVIFSFAFEMRMARKAIIFIFLNKRAHLYFISDIGGVLVVD
jgi:hypothetical protein